MTVGVAFWAFGIAIFRESTVVSLIFISGELVHLAAVIIISSLLYFTFVFPSGSLPKRKIMFVLLYVFPIAISISTMIPGVVVEKVISNDGINALVYAKFFPVFALFVVIYAIWALVKMVKKYRQSSGLYRLQLRYLFLGIFISAIIGIIANLILPGVGIFKYNWIGPSGTVVMIAFIGYAIAKYRLMDIKVIINRSLIYFILVAFVTASFTFLTYFTASVFKDVKGFSAIGVTFIVSLIIVTTLEPLKRFIAKNTDKVFFRGRIDYQQLLLMLSEVISLEIDLENLTKAVTGTLTKELKLKDSIIFLPNKTGGGFTAVADEDREIGTRITKNHPLLAYLKKYRDLIVVEEMEREIADMKEGRDRKKRELIMYRLEDLGASICVPVFVEGELKTVLVLGKKLSGDIFNNDDLNLLEVFAPQLGTAIEKAKLYKEVSDFNIKLRDEVKKATNNLREANLELQSRNSFLENLQRITNLITRTLSFKSVTRDIVNSISDDLGYVGGILLLVDRDKDRIYIEAYSQSHLAKKAISLLPKPIKEYDSILSKANTLSAKVVRTGQIQTSKSFSDFVAPPVPRQVANLIQKLMGIQTTVGVPIYSEDRIVGAIIFLIDKDEEKVSDMDFSMMNALANQTGIVFKNLELVNEIQKANKQLQVANYHLKQLDEAKSEFMSIASHQLRTPLAGIMGYLSMLQEGDFGAMTPDQSKVIADVFDGSRRLIRMVNLFLNVTRIEAGRFKLNITKVDIVKVIQSEVKELRPTTAKKKLKLNFIVPKEKIPQLNVDEDKIKDVVLNLVDNAIKYTEKGGITVTVQKKDNNVLIIVKDTGVGINPTDAEKLFSKFVRGSGISRLSPDGSGLGLFIARKIVDAHKGKIWAESEGEGKGSKFSVELPVK
jgi:signal transduction histidine kinase